MKYIAILMALANILSASVGYVANYGSHTVSVVDLSTQSERTQIAVGSHPHGTWMSNDAGSLYVANTGSDSISVIDTATQTRRADVAVGTAPVELLSANGFIFTANSGDNTVSVINEQSLDLVATIPVGQGPEGIERARDESRVFVSNALSGEVSVIDTAAHTVVATIALGADAHNLRLSENGTKLYVSAPQAHAIIIIDVASLRVVNTIVLPETSHPVEVLAFRGHLYVTTTGDGTLYKISEASDHIVEKLQLGGDLHGLSAVAAEKMLLSHTSENALALVDINQMRQLGVIDVGMAPRGVVVNNHACIAISGFSSDVCIDISSGHLSNVGQASITGMDPENYPNSALYFSAQAFSPAPSITVTLTFPEGEAPDRLDKCFADLGAPQLRAPAQCPSPMPIPGAYKSDANTWVYSITDNGSLDADPADGIIFDPVAFYYGFPVPLSWAAKAFMALLLGMGAFMMMRRKA